jgi:two-component system chemotaxis sensor kinase CheA
MFGFNAVAQFTHKMETLLDLLRNGQKAVSQAIADLLLRSTDCLKTLIEAVKGGAVVDDETVQRLTSELASASQLNSQPATADIQMGMTTSSGDHLHDRTYAIAWTPPAWLFQRGLDPLQSLKGLNDLGSLTDRKDIKAIEAVFLSRTAGRS